MTFSELYKRVRSRSLYNQWTSVVNGGSMISTDREKYINLMDLLLTHFPFIPVYGIAHINGVDNVIQYMNKVTQYHHQQQPGEGCNQIHFCAQSTHGF